MKPPPPGVGKNEVFQILKAVTHLYDPKHYMYQNLWKFVTYIKKSPMERKIPQNGGKKC